MKLIFVSRFVLGHACGLKKTEDTNVKNFLITKRIIQELYP